jgi:hypothetical protein
MRYLTLGKTGMEVSEVGFGGIPIIRLSMEEAVAVLHRALDRGVTLFDTANLYMDSEEKFGRALAGERQRLVLATKSIKRDRDGVEADINLSLTKMRTDYIDLFQFHQVSQEDHLEAIIGPGGALEGVARARQAGKIRHVGVTSHSLEMAVRLVKMGIFSTIQFPFSFIEEAAAEELHPAARLGHGGGGGRGPGPLRTGKRRHPGAPGRHGALPGGTGGQILPALRILPALPPGGDDHPGHAVRHCGPPHGPGQGLLLCRQNHGNRETVYRMPGMRGALPLRPAHRRYHPPPPGPVRGTLPGE